MNVDNLTHGPMVLIPQGNDGISLRDWFAGMALAHPTTAAIDEPADTDPDFAAKWAYEVADAMIRERLRKK